MTVIQGIKPSKKLSDDNYRSTKLSLSMMFDRLATMFSIGHLVSDRRATLQSIGRCMSDRCATLRSIRYRETDRCATLRSIGHRSETENSIPKAGSRPEVSDGAPTWGENVKIKTFCRLYSPISRLPPQRRIPASAGLRPGPRAPVAPCRAAGGAGRRAAGARSPAR